MRDVVGADVPDSDGVIGAVGGRGVGGDVVTGGAVPTDDGAVTGDVGVMTGDVGVVVCGVSVVAGGEVDAVLVDGAAVSNNGATGGGVTMLGDVTLVVGVGVTSTCGDVTCDCRSIGGTCVVVGCGATAGGEVCVMVEGVAFDCCCCCDCEAITT